MRVGYGFDIHRLAPGCKLVLGGVEIPSTAGAEGHSDADVLLHAIMDALLGACALGDIGRHFPDTDPRFKDISSLILLKHVSELLARHRFAVSNIDATVVLETPRIASYAEEMRVNISRVLGIDPTCVSIKATTSEGLGAIGSGRGIAAQAVALVTQR
jgi:2-C-methyl-D-erythritol 2,4-cyclodiphosphate synthase